MNHQPVTRLFHRYIRSLAIENGIADQVSQSPADQRFADQGALLLAALVTDLVAEIAEFIDDGFDQRPDIDRVRLLRRATQSGERKDVVERVVDILDPRDHPLALTLVRDTRDAHPQRRERGTQIVADSAQHDVLFADHVTDPAAHGVERADQLPRVGRPLLRQLLGLARTKGMGPGSEQFQRSRDIAPQQDQGDEHQQIDGDGLEQEGADQHRGTLAHGRGDADPAAIRLLRRDDHEPPGLGRGRPATHRPVDRIVAPFAAVGSDQVTGHRAWQIGSEGGPDLGESDTHIGKGLTGAHFQFRQAWHRIGHRACRAIFQSSPAPGAHAAVAPVGARSGLPVKTEGNARYGRGRRFHQILVLRAPVKQEAVDALCQQQHQRHQQQKLSDQTAGPEARQRDFTSPAST